MLIAVEYLGSVGVGATSPQFFRADDDNIYVVKLQNNRLGPKVLANEFVAARLGKLMNLCFPRSDIIQMSEQGLKKKQGPMTPAISPGRHFASLYLDNTEYVGKHNLHQAINKTEMAGVLLFDHLFHNADRANNKKNLLLRREETGCKIYAIDHSHLFRTGRWTLESLADLSSRIKPYYRHSFGILLKDYLSSQDFLPYVEKVGTINNKDIEKIMEEIPEEWLPNQLERQGLTHHITLRCAMAHKIFDILCDYIPQTRGGYRWLF